MFLGHFAVGLAAKPFTPKAPLGVLLVATQVIDILYAVFLIAGVGRTGATSPWDHGLVMSALWSVAAFAIAYAFSRDLRSGIVIGLLVLSHWVGDFISWDHVLPLAFGGSPLVGLGLYNSVVVMLAGDFGLFAGAIAIYLLKTKAKDRMGIWAFWLMIAYILAMMPACALPGKLIIIAAFLMLTLLPFGIWIDRHRFVIPVKRESAPRIVGQGDKDA
jgi:hypothetical protein